MSNMEDIIAILQNETTNRTERWVDSKTGWNNLESNQSIDCKSIKTNIEKFLQPLNEGKQATHFTIVKKGDDVKVWRLEEALERFIVLANGEDFKNQYNINGAANKESIDLVIKEKESLKSLIELKPWDSKNTPTFGLVEVLKNYILLKSCSTINNLILLAPKNYYISYNNKSSVKKFFELVNCINNDQIQIQIAYIDLEFKDFQEVINKLANKVTDWKQEENSQQYDKRKLIKPMKEDIVNIEKKLLYENWQFIDQETWLKL